MPGARFTGLPAVTLCLTLLAGGCASGRPAGPVGQAPRHGTAVAHAPRDSSTAAVAAEYLAIAGPANRRLDAEADRYTDHEHDNNLAAAESDLRTEAETERRFDQLLEKVVFPPPIAVIAGALARANQVRAALTGRQARSSTLTGLLSFTSRHRAADAAVEAQVRIIRRALGLPPPQTS